MDTELQIKRILDFLDSQMAIKKVEISKISDESEYFVCIFLKEINQIGVLELTNAESILDKMYEGVIFVFIPNYSELSQIPQGVK